jgi:hypothetical protein
MNDKQNWKASYGPSEMYSLELLFMCEGVSAEILGKSVNLKTFIDGGGRATSLPQHTRSVLSNGMVLGTQYPARKVSTPAGTLECYAKIDDALSDAECVRDYVTERLAFENLSTGIASYWTSGDDNGSVTFKGAAISAFKVLLWKAEPNRVPVFISSV